MMGLFLRATECLQEAGWTREPPPTVHGALPDPLHTASDMLIRWASSFSLLSSSDETVWFLSRDEYSAGSEGAFSWDECEQVSLQSAMTARESAAVRGFWQRHTPILLSVRSGYEYLAVRDDGRVVHGAEPDFEEASVVCSDFEFLLERIASRTAQSNDAVERLLFGGTSGSDVPART